MCCSKISRLLFIVVVTQLLFACAKLQTVMQEKPDTTKQTTAAPNGYAQAIDAAKNGKSDEAIKLLTQITSDYPDFSIAHTNLGLQYLAKGKLDQAEKVLRKAISIRKDDAIAYNHLGVILRQQGKFDQAKEMYINAIKSVPQYADAHLNLGILYDIYLYELPSALEHYKIYQDTTNNSDKLVSKWIIDLERRIKSSNKG